MSLGIALRVPELIHFYRRQGMPANACRIAAAPSGLRRTAAPEPDDDADRAFFAAQAGSRAVKMDERFRDAMARAVGVVLRRLPSVIRDRD